MKTLSNNIPPDTKEQIISKLVDYTDDKEVFAQRIIDFRNS